MKKYNSRPLKHFEVVKKLCHEDEKSSCFTKDGGGSSGATRAAVRMSVGVS